MEELLVEETCCDVRVLLIKLRSDVGCSNSLFLVIDFGDGVESLAVFCFTNQVSGAELFYFRS